MLAVLRSLAMFIVDLFKSRRRLEAENLFLRHQLSIALRRAPPRLRLRGGDGALLVWMTRLWPGLLGMAQVVQPETILRWHRAGFKAFWRWKSRKRAGRPKIDRGLRDLIRPDLISGRDRLQKIRWAEGRNVHINIRWGTPEAEAMQQLAKELVALQPDVIVTQSTPGT